MTLLRWLTFLLVFHTQGMEYRNLIWVSVLMWALPCYANFVAVVFFFRVGGVGGGAVRPRAYFALYHF